MSFNKKVNIALISIVLLLSLTSTSAQWGDWGSTTSTPTQQGSTTSTTQQGQTTSTPAQQEQITSTSAQWKQITSELQGTQIQQGEVTDVWTLTSPGNSAVVSTCNQVDYVGGYKVFGVNSAATRLIQGLPQHFQLRLQVQFLILDSWDNEWMRIYVDDVLVWEKQYSHGTMSKTNWHKCGWQDATYGRDLVQDVDIMFPHASHQANIKLVSTLNQHAGDESWGFRAFSLSYKACEEPYCSVQYQELSGDFKTADVAKLWTLSTANNVELKDVNQVNSCENLGKKGNILGGYGVLGEKRTLSRTWSLPSHYKVIVSFKFSQFGSYAAGQQIIMTVDGFQQYVVVDKDKNEDLRTAQSKCNNVNAVRQFQVTQEITHTNPTLTIRLQDNFGGTVNDNYWGIYDVEIMVFKCNSANGCTAFASDLTGNFTQSQVKDWYQNLNAFNTVTNCKNPVLGLTTGPLRKTFTNLPKHNKVLVTAKVYAIDSWDAPDGVRVFLDKAYQTVAKKANIPAGEQVDLCGSAGWKNDQVVPISLDIFHSESSLEVLFQGVFDQAVNDESYAIRDVNIYTFIDSGLTEVVASFTSNDFNSDEGWTVSKQPNKNARYSQCGGKQVLGGGDRFSKGTTVERSFTGLPKHDSVIVTADVYLISSWDNELFRISVDGLVEKSFTKTARFIHLCGVRNFPKEDNDDQIVKVEFEVPHTASTLSVKFWDSLDQVPEDESWGIRNIRIYSRSYGSRQDQMSHLSKLKCPTIFSECNFQGKSLQICERNPNFAESKWSSEVKSVYIPDRWKLWLYHDSHYNVPYGRLEQSIKCLNPVQGQNKILSSLAEMHHSSHKSALRANKQRQ